MSLRHTQNDTVFYTYNDDKTLPAIIMIHGFRGTHHGLDLIALNLNGFRVIVPDLPGFGESAAFNSEHSVNNYVIWLKDFIKNLNLTEPPILLGHSFGSIVTSFYASQYPNTIKKLVLVNPIGAPATSGPKAIMTKLALFYYWLGVKLPEVIAKPLLSSKLVIITMSTTMAKAKDKSLRKYIHKQHLMYFNSFVSRKAVTEAFKASIGYNVRDVATKIITPTLLIVGDQDDITPLKMQQELQKMITNSKIKIINKTGHLTHYEAPTVVADAIKAFVF